MPLSHQPVYVLNFWIFSNFEACFRVQSSKTPFSNIPLGSNPLLFWRTACTRMSASRPLFRQIDLKKIVATSFMLKGRIRVSQKYAEEIHPKKWAS